MRYYLGKRSIRNLKGVHPVLVEVVHGAIEITKQDFSVICGLRTDDEQAALYAQGRTTPGKIVTWTMKSRHMMQVDGFGHAVDLVPYPVDWGDLKKFDLIADAMFASAKQLGVEIRWGADWDQDGNIRERGETDSPHFEIVC